MSRSNHGKRNGAPADEPQSRSTGADHAGDRLDEMFDVLGSGRRRRLLYYLKDMEGTETTLERAVRALNAFDSSRDPPGDVPRRQSIRVSLAHNHLPRLDAANVLEYDHRSGGVRYEGHDQLDSWLDCVRELEFHRPPF